MMRSNRTRAMIGTFTLSATLIAGLLAASAQVLGPPAGAGAAQPAVMQNTPVFNPRAALEALQMRPVGAVERKKHHLETEAIMADGRRVIVSFDLSGRLWEVEHAYHDKHRYGDGPINPGAAVEAVRAAGFTDPAMREVKRNHTVVAATTSKGEAVELHVDRAGVIYKQVWMR